MKSLALACFSKLILAAAVFAQAPAWYQTDFPPEEFKARWAKVFAKIGDQAVLVMQGVPRTPGYIMPRQTNEFYYLCGIETPHSYLLLDGRNKKATLYMPPRDRQSGERRGQGALGRRRRAGQAAHRRRRGAEHRIDARRLARKLPGGAPRTVYTLLTPAEGNSQARGELRSANNAIAQRLLGRPRFPRAELRATDSHALSAGRRCPTSRRFSTSCAASRARARLR